MTYQELSELLGIQLNSAKKLTHRRKWERVKGNDGFTRVRVPMDALPKASPKVVEKVVEEAVEEVVRVNVVPDAPPVDAHLVQLVETLKGQVEAERRRADAAEIKLNSLLELREKQLTDDRDAWRAHAARPLWSRLWGK